MGCIAAVLVRADSIEVLSGFSGSICIRHELYNIPTGWEVASRTLAHLIFGYSRCRRLRRCRQRKAILYGSHSNIFIYFFSSCDLRCLE